MNPEIKKMWVEALRSGEYKQTTGALRQLDMDSALPCYCCLGVLCDLAVKAGVTNPFYENHTACLPTSVYKWAGLDTPDPEVPLGSDKIGTPLTRLNDELRMDFKTIADHIEASL